MLWGVCEMSWGVCDMSWGVCDISQGVCDMSPEVCDMSWEVCDMPQEVCDMSATKVRHIMGSLLYILEILKSFPNVDIFLWLPLQTSLSWCKQ